MAGHSHSSNIKHRKNAQDAKKAKIGTKLLRVVYIAARNGGDLEMNAALRNACSDARKSGVLLDRIEAAIKRATSAGNDSENMEYVRYNATYSGVSIVIEGLTDNKNRTIGDLRTVFSKYGGSIADTGSVEFMFKNIGLIIFDKKIGDFDTVFEVAVNNGALDIEEGEEEYYIETEITDLHTVDTALIKSFGEHISANLMWKPIIEATKLSPELQIKFDKIIDALEDIDDVQNIYHN